MRKSKFIDEDKLAKIVKNLKNNYSSDWLLVLEIYELLYDSNSKLKNNILEYLFKLSEEKKYTILINNGLKLLEKNDW